MLENGVVQLRPLALNDVEALWPQASEAEIWKYMRGGLQDSPERLQHWVQTALAKRDQGIEYPFVTLDSSSRQIAGSTRFLTIDPPNRSLEIGGTWLGREFRGTAINLNAKYLMLCFAFESLGCVRVQFRTDSRNLRSQQAIEKLGAVREGVFRKDYIFPDGYQRSSVFYSVIDDDWPVVKRTIAARLYALSI
ncbi:GNAT family N-acetyltransferase [Bryobacter aggregatus]|uniref:GNAT family N-acetyltransferase n=1 Tax=Bryobacter aggregatus TaxID=360054 RepID=UPI00055F7DC4|nr:GNAT family protein [Bryobacter aggregatus]